MQASKLSIDLAASSLFLTLYRRHSDCSTFAVYIIYACPLLIVQMSKLVGSLVDAARAIRNTSVSGV